MPYHAILRRILTSTSLEEAEAEVAGRRRASSANYLIGSRDGRVCDVEAAPGGPEAVWRIGGDVVCHANHFVRPDRRFKDLAVLESGESPLRESAASAAIAARPIDVDALQEALRAHAGDLGADGSVCAHADLEAPPEADYVTVAGIVMDLVTGELLVTDGNPCEGSFERHGLDGLLDR